MIRLDKRLAACADMVKGDIVCDIGTDHGYLPVYLLEQGRCRRAVVTDIHQKPLDSAKKTAAASGVTEKMQFCLCDGSAGAELDGVTDIVIAGMGGEQIARIILADERMKSIHIIVQPMTKITQLRKELLGNGFDITAEAAVSSGSHIYTVLGIGYTGRMCSDEDIIHLGRLSPAREDDMLFVKKYIHKLRTAAEGMKMSSPDISTQRSALADRLEQSFYERR